MPVRLPLAQVERRIPFAAVGQLSQHAVLGQTLEFRPDPVGSDFRRRRDIVEAATGRRAGRAEHQLEKRTAVRSEEHTSELQSLMRISYAVFCLKKKKKTSHKFKEIQTTT